MKGLPEVNKYLTGEERPDSKDQVSTSTADVEGETPFSYKVHVFSIEEYPNNPEIRGHMATFNWYTVDKVSGEVKCSFYVYEDGKYLRASDSNEYPCD